MPRVGCKRQGAGAGGAADESGGEDEKGRGSKNHPGGTRADDPGGGIAEFVFDSCVDDSRSGNVHLGFGSFATSSMPPCIVCLLIFDDIDDRNGFVLLQTSGI